MLNVKSILKTAIGVSIIYITAIILSLFICQRVNELDSKEDNKIQNTNLVMNLK